MNRKQWQANVADACLTLNDAETSPEATLENGDLIAYLKPREEEPAVDRSVEILFEDPSILVIDKNPNVPVSESGRYVRNTLVNLLAELRGCETFPVHRLDRETSGVLTLAKTKEAARELGEQFGAGTPRKTYHALLCGELPEGERTVQAPLLRNRGTSEVFVRQVVHPEGKRALTKFRALWRAEGLTFVAVEPLTGRTHQIRCHAEWLGFPVLGDKLYGQTDDAFIKCVKTGENPVHPVFGTVPRQMLHASSLEFLHPDSRKPVVFRSDALAAFARTETLRPLLEKAPKPISPDRGSPAKPAI